MAVAVGRCKVERGVELCRRKMLLVLVVVAEVEEKLIEMILMMVVVFAIAAEVRVIRHDLLLH